MIQSQFSKRGKISKWFMFIYEKWRNVEIHKEGIVICTRFYSPDLTLTKFQIWNCVFCYFLLPGIIIFKAYNWHFYATITILYMEWLVNIYVAWKCHFIYQNKFTGWFLPYVGLIFSVTTFFFNDAVGLPLWCCGLGHNSLQCCHAISLPEHCLPTAHPASWYFVWGSSIRWPKY